ncbi:MAG: 23S rRNA (guanosine(2251)-2'-O)-methyltransferase RlmB [Oscillospiraceae bacterium]|nr:23S rRNA (guanosine(2251)-2'-O)-methyltransferase RlmB [Oscillospiraceae bacterium]
MDNFEKLIIYGKNAVIEALKAARPINALYVIKDGKGLSEHIAIAKKAGIVIKEANPDKLNSMSEGNRHGGIAAELASAEYSSVEEILAVRDKPFIIIADEIEDPHNLGALIRTAEAAGADGFIIPKRRSVQLTGAVYAASAGACAYLKIARVTNLTDTIKTLKKHNIWVYGAEADGEPYTGVDFSGGGVCLVIGSEGQGLSRLVRENCDHIVSIPMYGSMNSLNASVSGGILMYDIAMKIRRKGGGF